MVSGRPDLLFMTLIGGRTTTLFGRCGVGAVRAGWVVVCLVMGGWGPVWAAERPNIVLVITDDQGYGDLGHTGNPVVKTPHLDALAAESSRLLDYHVAPTCSPTRAALLTGHWSNRTGVWHTINGRSMLRANEVTLAQLLREAGYQTGLFGKWHLGDNFPYRPEDRGFTEVYRHGGGGIGQTPDVWDNAYFDGRYTHNGQVVAAEGFCTDVFFDQARRFIRAQAAAKQPFFAYISTNAPHGPLHTPQKHLDRYPDQPAELAAFYGMISNIDDQIGLTRALLVELGIARETLFVFTTDNGSATGATLFNAGMRGAKGSEYEGGHRVPFLAHWPAAGWDRLHTSDRLCHAVDLVPTLVEIAGARVPVGVTFDGRSIRALLDPAVNASDWPDRMLITDSQRVRDPVAWKQSAVMSQGWRLINGTELYDLSQDPGQTRNIAQSHPERVARMRAFYEAWWAELVPTFAEETRIVLGHRDCPVVDLTSHDWIQEVPPPWNQQQIREAVDARGARHAGYWAVAAEVAGEYEFELRRWPVEVDQPLTGALPAGAKVAGASRAFRESPGRALAIESAALRVDGREIATHPVLATDRVIRFRATLEVGPHELSPVFRTANGQEFGAYYCRVRKL